MPYMLNNENLSLKILPPDAQIKYRAYDYFIISIKINTIKTYQIIPNFPFRTRTSFGKNIFD